MNPPGHAVAPAASSVADSDSSLYACTYEWSDSTMHDVTTGDGDVPQQLEHALHLAHRKDLVLDLLPALGNLARRER